MSKFEEENELIAWPDIDVTMCQQAAG